MAHEESVAPGAVAAPVGAVVDSGLQCLIAVLRLFERPADAGQLRHRFGRPGRPFGAGDLVRAARHMGLKARVVGDARDGLEGFAPPALAEMTDGRFAIFAGARDGRVMVQEAMDRRMRVLDRAAFEAAWSGRLVLLARRARVPGAGAQFGLRWFVPALLKYRRLLSEVVVASFFLNCLALATPLFFQVIVDKVLVHRGLTTLDVLMVALVAVALFEALLGALRTYVFSHTTNRIDVELGARLFDHLLGLPVGYFEARRTGHSVARVRELETIRDFITGSGLTLAIDLFFTVVFFAVMWLFSPLLTLIALGSLPFYVAVAAVATPLLRRRLEEKFERGAANQAFLVETVTGVETVKALAVEPQAQRRWEEQLAAYVGASFRASNLGNVASQIVQGISRVTMALTLYFGALAAIDGELTVGQLVAFNMLLARVTGPILRLSQLWNDFQQARISVARLGDILNTPTEPRPSGDRAAPGRIAGRIRFESVTFRYRPDLPEALRRVSLDIPAGQTVGIVGASGSGKSTLAKLVQRLHAPESGRVLVDGVDLAMADTAWLRRQVGTVGQESVLFSRTVRENVALADPGMGMERIVTAARLAGAHEFVLALPQGYDTVVGERGASLSGGQRQRLAIARALVGDPRILILDEATSALDYESERVVHENMRRIAQGRTVLVIAHRLSAVRHADRIVVVAGGEIVEDGRPADLLAHPDGHYARMRRAQDEA